MAVCELSVRLVSTNVSDFKLSVLPVSVRESKLSCLSVPMLLSLNLNYLSVLI